MSIHERDYTKTNIFNPSDYVVDKQLVVGRHNKILITIQFDIDKLKYSCEVNPTKNIKTVLYITKPLTSSYHEMRKHLIKWLVGNDFKFGLPSKEEFWNLICNSNEEIK